jgi:hypothetical protein
MKRIFLSVLLSFVILGCNTSEHREKTKVSSTKKSKGKLRDVITYSSKVIAIKDVLINGHEAILPMRRFNAIYKAIDSSKIALWECGNPFEFIDEAWMKKTYGNKNEETGTFENYDGKVTTLFGKQIEFNTNNHIVLFNTAFANLNSFEIPSHHILLNNHTSLDDFKKLFPNSAGEKLANSNAVRF